MLKPNTLLILGAAVSAELGMPLGEALKNRIADVLPHESNGDDYVRTALYLQSDLRTNSVACKAIRQALPKAASIDNLIEHRGHDAAFKHCAKVGIVAAIILAERKSRVYRAPGKAIGSIAAENSTYAALFRLLVGNSSVDKLAETLGRVSVVNFNYDRCLEHYLHDWLVSYSGLDQVHALNLVDKLEVVRPYGGIGPLSRMANPAPNAVPFGANLDGLNLNYLANNILTFSEERDSEIDSRVKDATAAAEQVIFLGCAFHPQNSSLLKPAKSRARQFYGTCYVPPPEDPLSKPSLESFCGPTLEAFQGALSSWPADRAAGTAGRTFQFEPLTCLQLVTKYSPRWIDQAGA